jgi:hypothetical protein
VRAIIYLGENAADIPRYDNNLPDSLLPAKVVEYLSFYLKVKVPAWNEIGLKGELNPVPLIQPMLTVIKTIRIRLQLSCN